MLVIDAANFVGWMWPVPIVAGRRPVVSHEFQGGPRYLPGTHTLNYATHLGLDIMFPRIATDPTGPASDVAIPAHHSRNLGWITWAGTAIRAAGPGKVWEAKQTHLGWSVLVDHGKVGGVGMLTFYQHLAKLARAWTQGDIVLPGTALGIMGGDPSNAPHLRHLHFELWLPDGKPRRGDWPVDPAPYLEIWAQV